MFTVRKILHPTDFGPHAESAFQAACDLARKYNAELLLLHVLEPISMFGDMPVLGDPSGRAMAAEQMECVAAAVPDIKIQRHIVDGDPAREVVQMAKDQDCDLIVVGSHGRRGLARLLLGSVAQDVLRKAPCPVLVTNTAADAAAKPQHEFSSPSNRNFELEPFLDDLMHVLKTHAHETERLIEHVERHTDRLMEPSEMGIVISELSALQARLNAALPTKSCPVPSI